MVSVATLVNSLSWIFRRTCRGFCIGPGCFSLRFCVARAASFPRPQDRPQPASRCARAASRPRSASAERRRRGPCSGPGTWCVRCSVRTTRTLSASAVRPFSFLVIRVFPGTPLLISFENLPSRSQRGQASGAGGLSVQCVWALDAPSPLSRIAASFRLQATGARLCLSLHTQRRRRVSDRPNVTAAVSQGTGRPRKGERRGTAVGGASVKFTVLQGTARGGPHTITAVTPNVTRRRRTWVAQSVERLTPDFGSGHDPMVVGSGPASGSALSMDPGSCLGFSLSLSLRLSPLGAHTLTRSLARAHALSFPQE